MFNLVFKKKSFLRISLNAYLKEFKIAHIFFIF